MSVNTDSKMLFELCTAYMLWQRGQESRKPMESYPRFEELRSLFFRCLNSNTLIAEPNAR